MIILKLIQHLLNRILRHIYWLWNLNKIKGINSAIIEFPVVVEGKGRIKFGNKIQLAKYSSLRVASNATLSIGNQAKFGQNTDIRITANNSLTAGKQLLIENGSRLFVNANWQFGNKVKIATHCVIFSRESNHFGRLIIGEGTHIGDNTIIDVCDDISIGKEVAIGPNCVIYTHDHDYTKKDLPAWKGGVKTNPVTIEDGVWIGSGVTILPGVTIGERAVVAAGAVITKSIAGNAVYGGVPAKEIKKLN